MGNENLAALRRSLVARRAKYGGLIRELPSGEIDQRLIFKLNVVLPNVSDTIAAIDDGTYGICVDCGEKIPEKRLQIVPAARRCVGCQEELECGHAPA